MPLAIPLRGPVTAATARCLLAETVMSTPIAVTRRCLIIGISVAICAGSPAAAQRQALFNRVDLTGWHTDVPAIDTTPSLPSPFQVKGGVLVIAGQPAGHLISDSSYRNYRLEVEYRFTGKPGNAGVLIHASTPRALYGMFPKSIEVQMETGNAGDFWCIVEDIAVPDMERRRGPRDNWGITEGKGRRIRHLVDGREHAVGEWNRIVVEAVGRTVAVWVNGTMVNRGTNATADHGQIAIQSEGAPLEIRRITLTPLVRRSARR